jgi:hypothetical protein
VRSELIRPRAVNSPPASVNGPAARPHVGLSNLRAVWELVTAVFVFVLLEALIFRTGLYASILAPASYAGQLQRLVSAERDREPSGSREVLVLGDSRAAEGFSARVADAEVGGAGFKFINAAIPGSTLRTDYYLLRELDPTGDRYAAIVIPMDTYDDQAGAENLADRGLDLAFTPPLLRYSDLFDFPLTFESAQNRLDALFGCLLKGFAYAADIQDLVAHPLRRIEDVRDYRRAGAAATYNYAGHPGGLTGLTYDSASDSYVFPPELSAAQRTQLNEVVQARHFPPFPVTQYREQWLTRTLSRYSQSGTQFFFIQMPRGPVVPPPVHPESLETINWLGQHARVHILPRTMFEDLEQPDRFFDALHLNADGRAQFSVKLAHDLSQDL